MSLDHASTIKDVLDAATVLLKDDGSSAVFRGLMRDGTGIPDAACFCAVTGGFAPQSKFGGTATDSPTVQIMVRSPKRDRDAGMVTARAVYDAINHKQPSGYIDLRPQQSGINELQMDDNERFLFSVNAILRIDT